MPASMSIEPTAMNPMYSRAARSRAAPVPQRVMRNQLGTSSTTKKNQNTIRSSAAKAPIVAATSANVAVEYWRALPLRLLPGVECSA